MPCTDKGLDMGITLKPVLTLSLSRVLLASLFLLALAACNQDQSSAGSAQQSAAAIAKTKADLEAAKKAEAALAAMPSDELRKLASTAFREQRLYAPAGNNALEYYLAIRKKSDKPDALTESALMDLTPYTVIAAEQAITRLDFNEATRLRDLIAAVDANAPALPRISQAIIDGLKNTETLAATEAKQQEALITAEQMALKNKQALLKPAAIESPPSSIASVATPPVMTAPVQAPQIPVLAPPARVAAATTAVITQKAELISIRTPDPGFPSDALNRGLSGAVEIEFVVQRSGEVSEVRVVNSSQRAFDRNVMMTVKRWKFAPLDEPMTVRRSFNFNNPS
jgi:periplasmic protein TonB